MTHDARLPFIFSKVSNENVTPRNVQDVNDNF